MAPSSWLPGFQLLPAESTADPGQAYVKFDWRSVGDGINWQISNINASQWLPSSNVSEMITNMARDISTTLPRSAFCFSTDIPQQLGDSWEQETRAPIPWAWIIMPTSLLFF